MFAVGAPSRKAQSLLLTGAALLVAGVGAGLLLRRRKKKSAEAEDGLSGSPAARRPAQESREGRQDREARFVAGGAVLLILSAEGGSGAARAGRGVKELAKDFCGTVIIGLSQLSGSSSFSGKTVYLCGDVSTAASGTLRHRLDTAERVFVIGELSHGYGGDSSWRVVGLGRVPILVHGVGVHYRRFFEDCGGSLFDNICSEHIFQSLTESTKPGTAHRTGAYLTAVEQDGEDMHFRLLRCSTNLSGPTLNFGASDRRIVDTLNREAECLFENQAPLNHVLAQVYHNSVAAGPQRKQIRAKIKAHADKTKDMPENGIMAFCTFYDRLDGLRPVENDAFDYGHKGISGLTRLHFRLKDTVKERPGCSLARQFSVTLYPDSVFFMPLSTNRLYTHEIRPGKLDVAMLPTRLGYVVRCSETEAVHKEGQTFLKVQGKLVKLEPSTAEGVAELRRLYAEENITDSYMDYGQILFSMNRGDYTRPKLHERTDEIRAVPVSPDKGNLFAEFFELRRCENEERDYA